MKLALILLFLPSLVQAQWRPISVSTITDIRAISENFNRASLWSNRKLDKYSNDIIYGKPKFNKGAIFVDSTTLSGNSIVPANSTLTIVGALVVVGTATYTSTTTYQVEADLAALILSTAPLVRYSQWDAAYGWGDHALEGYLKTESDPVFGTSAASGIVAGDITNWNNGVDSIVAGSNVTISPASGKGDVTINATDTAVMYGGGLFEVINGNIVAIDYTTSSDSFWEYNAYGDIQPI